MDGLCAAGLGFASVGSGDVKVVPEALRRKHLTNVSGKNFGTRFGGSSSTSVHMRCTLALCK